MTTFLRNLRYTLRMLWKSQQVIPGYYNMLGRPFFLGRDFLQEEGVDDKSRVVILTHKLCSPCRR